MQFKRFLLWTGQAAAMAAIMGYTLAQARHLGPAGLPVTAAGGKHRR